MTAPDPSPTPSAAPSTGDVGALLRAGDYRAARRALAPDAELELHEALSAVVAVQDHLRARHYAQARRAAANYAGLVEGAASGERSVLRRQLPPQDLVAALAVLEERPTEPDPAVLEARLAPALSLALTRPEALNARGVLAGLQQDEAGARAFLTEAVELDPGHYRAWTNLANLDLEAGRFQDAESRYRQVIALNPEYDVAHHNLGVTLRRQGRLAESVRSIRTAQRLNVRRSRDEERAQVKEQFSGFRRPRWTRWLLVAVLMVVLYLLVRGPGV